MIERRLFRKLKELSLEYFDNHSEFGQWGGAYSSKKAMIKAMRGRGLVPLGNELGPCIIGSHDFNETEALMLQRNTTGQYFVPAEYEGEYVKTCDKTMAAYWQSWRITERRLFLVGD